VNRKLGLLIVATLGVTACSGSSGAGHHGPSGGPARSGASPAQIRLADLERCPRSSPTAVPGGLPDITLACLGNGPAVHLAGLTGRPTVVNIWGSWCGPCQDEAAALSSVYRADRGKVRFLGVDTEDDPDSALNFDAHVTPPVRYPSVFDPDKKLLLDLHFDGPPETVLVDSAGKVVHTHAGAYSSAQQLRSDLATYLKVT
jgi:thiol-disulfide isomerase/thioredoxin